VFSRVDVVNLVAAARLARLDGRARANVLKNRGVAEAFRAVEVAEWALTRGSRGGAGVVARFDVGV